MSAFAVKWVFVLDADYTIDLGRYYRYDKPVPAQAVAYFDRFGKERLVLHPDGKAVIRARYAWDGCTPKFALWDILFGTPDGVTHRHTFKPKAYHASLVHDVLYQFLDVDLPIDRRGADQAFHDILERDAFGPRWLYWAAVRVFGGLFHEIAQHKRKYEGFRIVLPADVPAPVRAETRAICRIVPEYETTH